ncbi:MAG: hypothetical protein KatS3mg119_2416 [Rhodothalassiaceae bacterium]|nr:MAG: hypothetical protein KatS3mg119_2416 [Rhodothalassiaceae bacterium]
MSEEDHRSFRRDPGVAALQPVDENTLVPWEGGRLLHAWWFRARGAREMPARSDFEPRVMGRHLAGITLHDVLPEEPRFRVRLVGSDFVEVLGYDPTGMWVADLPGGAPLVERYRWMVANRRPYMALDLPLRWANRDYDSYSTLVMPLSSDGREIDMLIAHVDVRPAWRR